MHRPPPPRRAPPATSLVKEHHTDTPAAITTTVRASGAAVTSLQLLQMRDAINDITIAVATAEGSLRAIKKNPVVHPPTPGAGASTGGVDVQSLAFASTTRTKLAGEEKKQDAYYHKMPETAKVVSEVQRAARDPVLQRFKQHAEVQLAAAAADGRLPQSPRANSLIPMHQHVMLNPYSMANCPSRFAISSGSFSMGSSATSPNPPSSTAPFANGMPATVTSPYRPSNYSVEPSYMASAAPAGAAYGTPHYPSAASSAPAPAYSPIPPTTYGAYGSATPQQPQWNQAPAHIRPQRFQAL